MATITILQPDASKYHLYKIKGCCSSGNLNKITNWNFEPNSGVNGKILAVYNTSYRANSLEYALVKADPDVFDCDGKINGKLTITVQCWNPCAYQRSFFNQPLDIVQIGGFAGTVTSKNKHQLGRIRNPARGNYHSWRYDKGGTYLTNEIGVDVPIGTKLTFQVMGGWGQTRYVWLGHQKSLNLHMSEDFSSTDFNNVLADDTTRSRTNQSKSQLPSQQKTFYPSQLRHNQAYGSLTLVENTNYAPELTTVQPDLLKAVGGFTVDRYFAKTISKKERESIELWDSGSSYTPGDMVRNNNQIWFCNAANTNRKPTTYNRADKDSYINNDLDPFDPIDYWVEADNIFNTPHKFTVHAKDLGATCLYVSDSQGCTIQYVINVVASHCTKWSTIEGASSNSNEYTVGTTRGNLPKNRVAPLTHQNNTADPFGHYGLWFTKNNSTIQGNWRKGAIDRTNIVPIHEDWATAKYYFDNGTEETQSQHFSWCDCDSVITDRTQTFFEDGNDQNHPHSIATFNEAEHMFFNGWGFYSNLGAQQNNLIQNAIPQVDDNSTFIYCDRWRDRNERIQYENAQGGLIQDAVELPVYTPRCLTDSVGNTPTTDLGFRSDQQGDPAVIYAGFDGDIEHILPPWFLYNDLGEKVQWTVSVVERSDASPRSPMASVEGAGWAQEDNGKLHVGPWTSQKNSDKAIISVKKNQKGDGFYLKAAGVTNFLPAMVRISRKIPRTNGISYKGHLYSLFPMAGPRQPREVFVNNDDPNAPNQSSQGNSGQKRVLLSRNLFFGGVTSLNTRRIPIDGLTATIDDSCVPWTQSDLFARVMVLSPAIAVGVANSNLDGSEFIMPAGAKRAAPNSRNVDQLKAGQADFNRDVYEKRFRPNLEVENPNADFDNLRNQLWIPSNRRDAVPQRTIIDFGPMSKNVSRKFRIYFNFHKGSSQLTAGDSSFDPSGIPYVYVAAYPVDQHANKNHEIFSGKDTYNFLKEPGHKVPKRCVGSNSYYIELELNDTKDITTALGFMQIFIEFKPDIKSRIRNNHPYFQTAARNNMKIEEKDDWFFHKGIQQVRDAVFLPYHKPAKPKAFCGGDLYYSDKVTSQGGLYTQLRGTEPIIPAFIEYMQHSPMVWDPKRQVPAILQWGRNGNDQQKIFAANALGRFDADKPIDPNHPFMFQCPFKVDADGKVNWISDLYVKIDGNNDPFWGGAGPDRQ